VLLREQADRLTISVSNPENEKATVRVQLSGKLQGEGVRVSDDETRSSVLIELPDGMDAGKTITHTLLRP
jgi:hypothetical protein